MVASHSMQSGAGRSRPRSGYAKGADTRRIILRAAIVAFGKSGYNSVSTRQIAAAAGVNQPAINYHFGSKEGLYLACAQAILDDFVGPLEDVSRQAMAVLAQGLDRPGAARQLKALLSGLADVMILSEEIAEAAGFVGREMRDPGLAYQYLYANLWAPGTELAARLTAAAKGHNKVNEADRVDAIMLISGISAFVPGTSVSMDIMRWPAAGQRGKALVLERLFAQIDTWVDA